MLVSPRFDCRQGQDCINLSVLYYLENTTTMRYILTIEAPVHLGSSSDFSEPVKFEPSIFSSFSYQPQTAATLVVAANDKVCASLKCLPTTASNLQLHYFPHKKANIYVIVGSLVVAATADAAMDEMKDHYTTSIFKNMDPDFWNPNVSWQKSNEILGYHVDAWHISKSLMVCSISVPYAILLHQNYPIIKKHKFMDQVLWFFITGVAWDAVFNIGYNDTFFGGIETNQSAK